MSCSLFTLKGTGELIVAAQSGRPFFRLSVGPSGLRLPFFFEYAVVIAISVRRIQPDLGSEPG